ncbi:PREDICTED: WD repeat-containing protein 62 isoform X2 [Nicrophorus vespilloides]|uniref:WD repeat-containing protein 62 isoform X2 n=1 Tax=Nicrophorus vespilloides TaxID=110193 RepID=A0ABM1N5B3_NICVS|nr:PREDICTED: WD repeat-containing protein 62 isoform X2 [Nicrophorus vespilloides]
MMPRNSTPLILDRDIFCTYKIKLERVLGVTVNNNAALASDPNSETVAYPAGCTVVLFNTTTGQQSHIINTSKKTVTSLAFSSCGRYLVTGECGHQPAVRIWDLQSDPQPAQTGLAPQVQQVAEFVGHKYGISCVAFSPTNKFVVSIGTQHDMIVNVWDWKSNIKVASNKISTKVKSIAFADNGSYFVTVGNRHVKFWFLEYGKNKYNKEAVPLMGRSAILGEQRNNYFCDVACGKSQCGDSTYAITRSGLLCEFNNRRLLDKWVELRTTSANCISVGNQFIFVGCADGIVRCFDPTTLNFITTLPRTHYLGVDVSLGLNITHMSSPPQEAKYPDTTAITYDESSKKLTCIYNDHSIYVWDVHNIRRVGKSHSFLYHSACIWGVEMAPPQSPLPSGTFLTCSSDDTIRVWTLDKLNDKTAKGMYRRNIYSNELLKVVYVDKELAYLKDLDASSSNVSNEKQDSSYDARNGVRSIRLSSDGKQLASGDRSGNIRIHETVSMTQQLNIEAHDAEVLCLEFSNPSESTGGHRLMASASRDRLIHVFDVNRDYNFLQTLDDHSSSITAVRFLTSQHGNLQMVSCGADKSLIFRSLGGTPNGTPQFQRGHNATGKTTLYDMEVDAGQKHVLTACQDRNVRIYSVGTGKHTKSFKGSTGDDGTLIKVVLDKSGIYLATSCTDKSLSVYDYYTGECMATMCGHSELVTGLRFTNDCRRLISASGDGCIFVWRVPHDMVITMHARLSQQAMRQGKTLDHEIFSDNSNVDFYEPNNSGVDNDYRFSIGQLPLWAKKHISVDSSPPVSLNKGGVAAPKGRWAQRAERNVGVKSIYTDSVIPFPSLQGSEDSKDSSLDGEMYTRRELSTTKQDNDFIPCEESYNEITNPNREISTSNINLSRGDGRRLTEDSFVDPELESIAHDGDIDSDQEYRHQPMYYPTQADSASGSEFTVTNMDTEELRRSHRRSKRGSLPPAINIQPVSISTGSQDSDDDDDEASTPSGENTDRNPMSILSVSSESLDQLVNREKYLQSTFESLSGAEMESHGLNKSSISSKYHTRTSNTPKIRNIAVVNAMKQTKNDSDTLKKREELHKRIAETKKKLQSIGHSSPLKYSQSIADLSHIPEKENRWNRKTVRIDDDSPENSLRRACSLSDLTVQGPIVPKRKVDQVSGKSLPKNPQVSRINRYSKSSGAGAPMMRSSSLVGLNHSDSDDNEKKSQSRLMRPTISSQNKIAGNNGKNAAMRKRHSHSVMNLSSVGHEDSSSEEMEKVITKPIVPPRNRIHSSDGNPSAAARKLSNSIKDNVKPMRNYDRPKADMDDTLTSSNCDDSFNVSTAELSTQLCDEVALQLTKAANNVVELYRRLTDPTERIPKEGSLQKADILKNLELTIASTQKVLQDITLEKFRQSSSHIDVNQTDAVKKLNDLISKGFTNDQNDVVNLMQQYSDIILDMMQQKIQDSHS